MVEFELVCKGTLVDLPVFNNIPRADKNHDFVEIFELVTLTYKTTPHTNPPYKIQDHGGIIGRNESGSELYFATRTMEREGRILAFPEVQLVQVDTLDSYVIPEEQAFRELRL